jgi:hypothetical protein
MKYRHVTYLVTVVGVLAAASVWAENIDPGDDGSQYAWSENTGWINMEPVASGAHGVSVGDFGLTGWMWGENVGWVSTSCQNTSSCGTENYGVTNDGDGNLGGHAWSENAGWISFSCANTSSCGAAAYGVAIDPVSGEFSGEAWAENLGWIRFASTGANPFSVKSGWSCTAPTGLPILTVAKTGGDAELAWTGIAAKFDVVRGTLDPLRAGGGDFIAATQECLADDLLGSTVVFAGEPAPAETFWFLVRPAHCGAGTFDSGGGSQSGFRDVEVEASLQSCS